MPAKGRWSLYDELIEGIPAGCRADEILCGVSKAYVRSGQGHGFGLVTAGETRPILRQSKLPGMSLRDLAAGIKSWNYVEASLALAAVNAYYNHPETAAGHGVKIAPQRFVEDRMHDPFIAFQNVVRNKKVAVIGHFRYLEQLFQPVCELVILEQTPLEGDYPYAAADYLLPECEYIFITCLSLVDKTLPRFLELAGDNFVTLVGPATPLAPLFFRYGVSNLSGFVIKDGEKARSICAGQDGARIYATGQKVSLSADGCGG